MEKKKKKKKKKIGRKKVSRSSADTILFGNVTITVVTVLLFIRLASRQFWARALESY